MDDNVTCHRTLAVQDCLDSEGIQRLVWPARSSDLNPIENVWDALGGKLLVEIILRQTRTPSSVHSQRNGINCLNSCWIMLCKTVIPLTLIGTQLSTLNGQHNTALHDRLQTVGQSLYCRNETLQAIHGMSAHLSLWPYPHALLRLTIVVTAKCPSRNSCFTRRVALSYP
ncbi:hypothetical protein TNCV_3948691 [Trichonephila clavipes]|nr:hypothetical protein TNCV_3948691 [Trichonephila clavipes]